ncbi:MAG: hypothetical protein ACOC8L_13280 [Spirochaetota bacterium]
MRSSDSIERLRSELKQDYEFIVLNQEKNQEMTRRLDAAEVDDEFLYAALGYTLHNLYNAIESYFYRVAKFFENDLGESDWHRSLVSRMNLSIDGVRPALIDRKFAERADELRRFRHLFRNLYKSPLIPEKIEFANRSARDLSAHFEPYHTRFDEFLRLLKSQLEQ